MIFSLMLWAPSWGGMLNGLLTLRGAWHKLRTDPVLKFFAAGVTFYGMATFEGPLLSIKSVNALAHYTDWIVGHVHSGTLGWNGFMAAGMFYFLAPKLWKTKLYSVPLANMHFWIGTVGILLYVAAMWVSGITQGLMLNSLDASGALTYPNFLETVQSIRLPMLFRVFGGGLYLIGFALMIYNLWMTIRSGEATNGTFEIEEEESPSETMGLIGAVASPSFVYSALVIAFSCVWLFADGFVGLLGGILFIATVVAAIMHFKRKSAALENWHESFLESSMPFTALVLVAAAIGGIVQIVPLVTVDRESVAGETIQHVYTPLELAGRDLYISEGCYNCHSQMIRPFVSEVKRYGEYSKLGDSIYDHPYQWGSRRAGPDLARIGGKYGDDWHYTHMMDTNALSPGSNMPNYPWLARKTIDFDALPSKIAVLRKLGVPFAEADGQSVIAAAKAQAKQISDGLAQRQIEVDADKQIVALIAYLQQVGKTEKIPTDQLASAAE
jgi:cytochrome c oxidase cbb3-type subunit I/II